MICIFEGTFILINLFSFEPNLDNHTYRKNAAAPAKAAKPPDPATVFANFEKSLQGQHVRFSPIYEKKIGSSLA